MNICVFIRELSIGGAEKQSLLLCKALANTHHPQLIVLRDNVVEKKYLDFINDENIQVVFLSGGLLKKILQFIRILKRDKVEIIFSYLFSNNIIGLIAGRIAKVPFIIGGIRNCVISRKKYWLTKQMHNNFLEYSIFNNYSGLETLCSQGFSRDKSIVIPNCFENHEQAKEKTIGNVIEVITVARFMPQKDYITALKAIYHLNTFLLRNADAKIHYSIVGYGPEEDTIKAYIITNQMQEYVSVVIKPDDLEKYLEKADIYLSTSLYEGLSNSIMEAMSFSLPIVATDVGDNNKLVAEGENGFLLSKYDDKAIADKLYYLISNKDLLLAFGRKSFKLLTDNYSLETFAQNYLQFIEKLDREKN